MNDVTKPAEGPQRPSLLLGGAHLAALWALAFAQPMLALLGDNSEFFVARGNTTWQIIVYALTLTFLPPLIGLGIEALARLAGRNLQWAVHLGLMTLVGACLLLQVMKDRVGFPAGIQITLCLILAAAGVYAYARWKFPRTFMDFLSVSPILILIVFLFFSGTSKLILPRQQPDPVNVKVSRPAPVVVVVLDELPLSSLLTPDGRVNASRYPAFAELAESSTWYRGATGAAAYSPLAVPALLSGQKPSHGDLPVAADYPRSIFTLLGGSYRMNVMEDATRLCPEDLCPREEAAPEGSLGDLFRDLNIVSEYLLLPDSLTTGLPDVTNTFAGFGDGSPDQPESPAGAPDEPDVPQDETALDRAREGTVPAGPTTTPQRGGARALGRQFAGNVTRDATYRVDQFIRNIRPGQTRTLNLIHLEVPHIPWDHIPSGQRYTKVPNEWSGILPDDGAWDAPQNVVDIPFQRHLLQTGYADTLLGMIIDRLKRTGLWEESVVAVTADHGASFTAHVQRRLAVKRNLGAIAPIPMFIKGPGQDRPVTVARRACASDLLPAISDRLGIRYPWEREFCPEKRVTVLNSPEGQTRGTTVRVERQNRRIAGRIGRVFGLKGWNRVIQYGPYRQELIGRPVAKLKVERRIGPVRVGPDRRNQIKRYSPDAPLLFGLVQRGVTSRIGPGRVLAVAINGRIVATGWTFLNGPAGSRPEYSIMLPPDSLKKGFNRMDIYLVKRAGRELKQVYDGSAPAPPLKQKATDGA